MTGPPRTEATWPGLTRRSEPARASQVTPTLEDAPGNSPAPSQPHANGREFGSFGPGRPAVGVGGLEWSCGGNAGSGGLVRR